MMFIAMLSIVYERRRKASAGAWEEHGRNGAGSSGFIRARLDAVRTWTLQRKARLYCEIR